MVRATASRDRPKICPKEQEETGQTLGAPDQGKRVRSGEQEGDRSLRESLSAGASPQASAGRGKSLEGYETDVEPPWQDARGLSRREVRWLSQAMLTARDYQALVRQHQETTCSASVLPPSSFTYLVVVLVF